MQLLLGALLKAENLHTAVAIGLFERRVPTHYNGCWRPFESRVLHITDAVGGPLKKTEYLLMISFGVY